jgi:hypothetical protein
MKLEQRLRLLESQLQFKQPGCDVTIFIVVPEEFLSVPEDINSYHPFNSETYRPAEGELEKYLKQLKESGECQNCKGSCAIDWSPDGLTNHTLSGERTSSSPEPKVSMMFCADAETPVLTRRIMNGEITG